MYVAAIEHSNQVTKVDTWYAQERNTDKTIRPPSYPHPGDRQTKLDEHRSNANLNRLHNP